jgi:hypothetical protein
MSNRSKFFSNLSLNQNTVTPTGNFSVSGGDSIFRSATKPAAGPVKPCPLAHAVFLVLIFCAHGTQMQNDTLLPDAVKFIHNAIGRSLSREILSLQRETARQDA